MSQPTPLTLAAAAPSPKQDEELRRKLLELKKAGLTFGDVLHVFGQALESSPYGRAAHKHFNNEGELEFDDVTVVSEGGDPGAYVMCWRWIGDELLDEDAAAA